MPKRRDSKSRRFSFYLPDLQLVDQHRRQKKQRTQCQYRVLGQHPKEQK